MCFSVCFFVYYVSCCFILVCRIFNLIIAVAFLAFLLTLDSIVGYCRLVAVKTTSTHTYIIFINGLNS